MNEKESLAQRTEDQARKCVREKRYDDAIEKFIEAMDLNNELGFYGQAGIIQNEIHRIETMKALMGSSEKSSTDQGSESKVELEKKATQLEMRIKKLNFDENYDGLIETYTRSH